MTIENGNDGINGTEKGEAEIHYLPMKIDYNGKVEVTEKFLNTVRRDGDILETEFRGYPLKGQKMKMPAGCIGVVTQPCESLGEAKNIKSEKTFKEMTYWNYDRTPSGMDPCIKVMDWVEVAHLLHAPLGQLETEVKKD